MQAARTTLNNAKLDALHHPLTHDTHIYRPSSPLSTNMSPSALRSASRLPHQHTSQQRSQNLHLSGLPRFHPANYSSQDSSPGLPSPYATPDGPQPPISPRQQHRQLADTQRHLYHYPRDMSSAYSRNGALSPTAALRTSGPSSPRLAPLGSPGPVTPFELEGVEGYMSARMMGPSQGLTAADKNGVVDSFERKKMQAARGEGVYLRGSTPHSRASSP